MTTADAAKILELPTEASPEQAEARFHELRTKLEDRIAKAPTPGLKAKYREALEEITLAYETLTLAADFSALPVLRRQSAKNEAPGANATASPPHDPVSGLPPKKAKSGGKEFIVVAIIAVAVLALGGWWVIKTKGERAEKARIAAEAQAEAERQAIATKAERERQAEEARLAAEAQKRAEAEEKARIAAAAQAEQERKEKLMVTLRTQLAEARVTWSGFEAESRLAERKAGEARDDLRALGQAEPGRQAEMDARASAATAYAEWTAEQVTRHPLRFALVRLDSLLAGRDPDLASGEAEQLQAALEQLAQAQIAARRDLLSVTGTLRLTSEPGSFQWEIRDAFGRTHRGQTPGTAEDIAVGPALLRFTRVGWPTIERTTIVRRGQTEDFALNLPVGRIALATTPANIAWSLSDALGREFSGTTPARVEEVSAGRAILRLARSAWPPLEREVVITANEEQSLAVPLPTGQLTVTSEPAGAEVRVGETILGKTPLLLRDAPAGPVTLGLYMADYQPGAVSGEIPAAGETSLRGTLAASLVEANYPLVYVVRQKRVLGMAVKVKILVNEQEVFSLSNGDYQVIKLRPGNYRFTVDPWAWGQKSVHVDLRLEPRQSYYLMAGPVASAMSTSALLESVAAAEGQAALNGLSGNPQPQLLEIRPN